MEYNIIHISFITKGIKGHYEYMSNAFIKDWSCLKIFFRVRRKFRGTSRKTDTNLQIHRIQFMVPFCGVWSQERGGCRIILWFTVPARSVTVKTPVKHVSNSFSFRTPRFCLGMEGVVDSFT